MPIFSFYAKISRAGKRKHKIVNMAVHTIYDAPAGYQNLKSILLDVGRTVYHWRDHQTLTEVSMERHLLGRYKRGMTGHRTSRIHYKRQPILKARILYLPQQDEIRVERMAFIDPEVWGMREEYRREKGLKWKLPPLVPPGFYAMLNDPKSITRDLCSVKTRSYAVSPQNLYAPTAVQRHEAGMYAGRRQGFYGCGQQVYDKDKYEKENEH